LPHVTTKPPAIFWVPSTSSPQSSGLNDDTP
jgi:hypothetical protein